MYLKIFQLLRSCATIACLLAASRYVDTSTLASELSYVLSGTATCTEWSRQSEHHTPGSKMGFLVAMTPMRALVGWTQPATTDHVATGTREIYVFVDSRLTHRYTFETTAPAGSYNLLAGAPRHFAGLAKSSKQVENSWEGRRKAIELAVFYDFLFSLFFSSEYLGVSHELILDSSGDDRQQRNVDFPTGILTVSCAEGKIRAIRFTQRESDQLHAGGDAPIVKDASKGSFSRGLAGVLYECVFIPPLSFEKQIFQSAINRVEWKLPSGTVEVAEFTINVDTFDTGAEAANHVIDRILGRIPDGAPVMDNDPVRYIWNKGAPAKDIDQKALIAARGEFSNSPEKWNWWLLANIVVVLILSAVIIRRYLASTSTTHQ
jgi:hypothetical protein